MLFRSKNKETAANHFVDFLLGKDVDANVLKGLIGFDPALDDAINLVLEDELSEEDDESYDEDGWDYDEDEE